MEKELKRVLVVVAISVLVESGYTKVSVIANASQGEFEPGKFSVYFPTNPSKNSGPASWYNNTYTVDQNYDDQCYQFVSSRYVAVKELLRFLRNRVFGDVIESLNNDLITPDQKIIEYKQLIDYSEEYPKRFEASICLINDALTLDPNKSWMLKYFGTPVLLDGVVMDDLIDPITHTRRMILAYLTS